MQARARRPKYSLRTFGAPALVRADGRSVSGLRRKDLALLTYLRLEARAHSRSTLTSLLWDGGEESARHSLCQAVVRIRGALGAGAVVVERDRVGLRAELPCDAPPLDDPAPSIERLTSIVSLGPDEFLAHFELGRGAHDFDIWADEQRARLQRWLVHQLDVASECAEQRGEFAKARELALLLTRIEPLYEAGHRRVMRSWSALGERVLALKQYQRLTTWLASEYGELPDPATRQLAEMLRSAGGAACEGWLEATRGETVSGGR